MRQSNLQKAAMSESEGTCREKATLQRRVDMAKELRKCSLRNILSLRNWAFIYLPHVCKLLSHTIVLSPSKATDWILCCTIAAVFSGDSTMRKFSEKILANFSTFSSLRKAITGFFLFFIPICVSLAFNEDGVNPLNPAPPIWWFTATAVMTILAFWLWEELVETTQQQRSVFLVIVGCIIIAVYRHEVRFIMDAADASAYAQEAQNAYEGTQEGLTRRLLAALKASPPPAALASTKSPTQQVGAVPPKPKFSYPFMVPGVWLLPSTWDFIINHRGEAPSYNVEMLFQDTIKQKQVLADKTSITPSDINSYQTIINLPEVDPKGRGSVFAKQFLWNPSTPDHEQYAIEITWRDGSAHEDISIEKVNDKWFYAMKVLTCPPFLVQR